MSNEEDKQTSMNGSEFLLNSLSQDHRSEINSKIIISKENMKSLFYKLASSEKIRTLKEKAINPDTLLFRNTPASPQSPKLLGSHFGLENSIATDTLLLSDANVLDLPIGDIDKEISADDNSQSNGLPRSQNSNGYLKDSLMSKGTTIQHFSFKMEPSKKLIVRTPTRLNGKRNNPDLNHSFIYKTSTNKQKQTKTVMKNEKAVPKKENQLNHSVIISKHKPKTSVMKKTKQSNENTISQSKKNLKTNLGIVEEYDYSKLLVDLQSIFGDDFEYFDEDLLFETLDDQSSKGLIKGLLLLAKSQQNNVNSLTSSLSKERVKYQSDIKAKNYTIENLTKQLSSINHLLKGIINNTEQYKDATKPKNSKQ